MKVLHVIQNLGDGGASVGVFNMCADGPRGVEHAVATLLPPSETARRRFEAAGVPVIAGPSSVRTAVEAADIVQLEWWNNPQINDFVFNGLDPSKRVLLHARGHFDAPWMCPSVALLRRVDGCTVTTPSAAGNPSFDANRRAAGLGPVRCVYSAAAPSPRQVTRRQRAGDAPVRFGYLGTVEPIKLHAQALEIIEQVVGVAPNLTFAFAGGGPLEDYRAEAARRGIQDHVAFLGHCDEPEAFLAGLDAFFYPLNRFTYATSEKALQEAMLAELPCVVFPAGGIRDLVDAQSASVVHSAGEAVEACVRLAASPLLRRDIGACARARVESLPFRVAWRDELAAAWRDVLERPAARRAPCTVRPEDLFAISTDRSACDPTQLSPADRSDFARVAAFVEEEYGAWHA